MEAALLTVHVSVPRSDSLGVHFHGITPVTITQVDPGSPWARAKLRAGDLVVSVSGREVLQESASSVYSLLRELRGAVVTMVVGRITPVPNTELEKKRALIVLQSKMSAGPSQEAVEVHKYKQTVGDAFAAVQDILGDLGGDDQVVPSLGHSVQEVEVTCGYDSDNLSSPPPSDSSDEEKDPLLDFSRDDKMTMVGGILSSGFKAKHAIEDMQKLLREQQEKTRKKQVASEKSIRPMFEPGKPSPSLEQPQLEGAVHVSPLYAKQYPAKRAPPTQTMPPEPRPSAPAATSPLRDPTVRPAPLSKSPVRSTGADLPPPTRKTVSPSRAPQSRRSPSPPPPIPPYSPPHPDTFELSNRPQYYRHQKKTVETEKQTYQKTVEKTWEPEPVIQTQPEPKPVTQTQPEPKPVIQTKPEPKPVTQTQPEPKPVIQTQSEPKPVTQTQPKVEPVTRMQYNVPLRRKKAGERLPGTETEGYIVEPTKKSFDMSKNQQEVKITDIVDIKEACRGLPENVHDWRREEVGVWLKQLSPTLYSLYFSEFSKHDITGRTLLRLTEPSLKSVGIQQPAHRRLLAMEVMRVKIQQEMLELSQLEEQEITYL